MSNAQHTPVKKAGPWDFYRIDARPWGFVIIRLSDKKERGDDYGSMAEAAEARMHYIEEDHRNF